MSPTVIKIYGLKVKIHAKDHHPAHVHVEGKGFEARFNLETLELMNNTGFGRTDIRLIEDGIRANLALLKEVWNEYHEE